MERRQFLRLGAWSLGALATPYITFSEASAEDTATNGPGLPVIELTGTPLERGRIHGEALRTKIQGILGAWRELTETGAGMPLEPIVADFRAHTRFHEAMARWTPDLLEEMRGIAEGAAVEYDILYMYNCTDEHRWFLTYRGLDLALPEPRGCSAFGICDPADAAPRIAQNLDIPSGTNGFGALLRVRHSDSDLQSYVYTVAGMVGVIGLNNAPVGVVNNALGQLNQRVDGLPVNFVVRGLLAQESYDAAVAFIQNVHHATGQNYILGGANGVSMFECSANAVVRGSHGESSSRFIHTNHPLFSEDINTDERFNINRSASNTAIRLEALHGRIQQAVGEISLEDIRETLSAHDDPENPVCRHVSEDPGRNYSAASVIYDLRTPPVLHLAPGPPCQTLFTTYQFS